MNPNETDRQIPPDGIGYSPPLTVPATPAAPATPSAPASSLISKTLAALTALLLMLTLGGCSTVHYYGQAIGGQLDLLSRRERIDTLLEQPDLKPKLRQQLLKADALRRFAVTHLRLSDGPYSSYADLERPFAVWAIFATEEFSLEPVTWCFPIVGCLAYRGYFDKENARKHARELRQQGLDVHRGGVPAYSTLGWFDDPLLNTFIHWPLPELAGLIFHEMAHERIYVAGDTAFNESYAEAVAHAGVSAYLKQHANPALLKRFQQQGVQRKRFMSHITQLKSDLEALYARQMPQANMRREKAHIIQQSRKHFLTQAQQPGSKPYARWFRRDINNAHLLSVNLYNRWVPAFLKLLDLAQGDFERFHRAVDLLAKMSPKKRQRELNQLMPQ